METELRNYRLRLYKINVVPILIYYLLFNFILNWLNLDEGFFPPTFGVVTLLKVRFFFIAEDTILSPII